MRKILIIDDQQDNLTSISAIIKNYISNCSVLVSSSGKEGIEIAKKEQPDTILLDIIMPEMDGYEVCSKLKNEIRTKHIPVILITAIKTDVENRVKGLDLGADAFLSKPIEPYEFTAQVNVMLRIKAAEDKLREEKDSLEDLVNEKVIKINYQESLLENVLDPVISLDLDFNITSWNRGAENLYGWEEKEVLGKSFREVVKPEYKYKSREDVIRILMTTGKFIGEVFHYTKEGEKILVHGSVSLVKDKKGIPIGIASIGYNVTKQREAEEALKESEERYKALYENAPLSYQSLDENGRFLDVNPMWLTMLGYQRDEVIGKYYKDYLHPDWKGHFEENFPAFKKRGYVHGVEFKIRHKDGHYLNIEFEGCIGYHSDGTFKQTYCVFKDITVRRKAEEELRNATDELEKHRDNLEEMVKVRTLELEEKNKELLDYNRLFEGREFRIKELRDQVKELKEQLSNR